MCRMDPLGYQLGPWSAQLVGRWVAQGSVTLEMRFPFLH